MQRALAILAGTSCSLLALTLLASVIAIREPTPLVVQPALRQPPPEPRLDESAAPPAREEDPDPLRAEITRLAEALPRDLIDAALGPLASHVAAQHSSHAAFELDAPERGLWVTRTDVRVPCQALDDALRALRDPGLGRPQHCERWVEAAAAVLERHGIVSVPARSFVETYAGDRGVRVLLVYAGWRSSPDGGAHARTQLVYTHAAAVHPREAFAKTRRQALDAVYRELALGPYYAEE